MDWPSAATVSKGQGWSWIGHVGDRTGGTCSDHGWGYVRIRLNQGLALGFLFSQVQKWWCCFLMCVFPSAFEMFS